VGFELAEQWLRAATDSLINRKSRSARTPKITCARHGAAEARGVQAGQPCDAAFSLLAIEPGLPGVRGDPRFKGAKF
jgi:hypothetical protein